MSRADLVRVGIGTLVFAVLGAAAGGVGAWVIANIHDVDVPRPIFERSVGPVVVRGRMDAERPLPSEPECGGPEWFRALIARPDGLDLPVGDLGRRLPRYELPAGLGVADQPVLATFGPAPLVAYLVRVDERVAQVQARFADGQRDAMRPVEGWALLVHLLGDATEPGTATIEAVGVDGEVVGAVEVPVHLDAPLPARCLGEAR